MYPLYLVLDINLNSERWRYGSRNTTQESKGGIGGGFRSEIQKEVSGPVVSPFVGGEGPE